MIASTFSSKGVSIHLHHGLNLCAERRRLPRWAPPPGHLEALSSVSLCPQPRLYSTCPAAFSWALQGVSSSRLSPPGPPMGVQVPACYTKEEKVTSSSERGESGGGICSSSLAITLALGCGTGPCGVRGELDFLLLQRLDIRLCWVLGSPCVSALLLWGPRAQGEVHTGIILNQRAPSSTVCKALPLPLPWSPTILRA